MYPREIEEVVTSVPGVLDAAVVGAPDPLWGQRPMVAFTTSPQSEVDPAAVLAHCRGRLPGFKVPKQAVALSSLPLGPTGKIDRRAVLDQLLDGPA